MSLVEKEISSVVGGSGGGCVVGDDGDDDDDECGSGSGGSHGRCRCSEEKAKKQRGFSAGGLSRNFGRAKLVVLHPFGRSKKLLPREAKTRGSASGASSLGSSCAFSSGKMFGGGGGNGGGNKGCYFCFTKPPTLDSPMGSPTSDPEHPNFTFGMLRAFVESNEFYSKDCNPHLDIDVSPYKMD
ncbi:uncharacterized protein [Pyrus communis]|uniref:uncharacterized protein n=1 Tax=Pyrus communis TaxID=23211 RepID=UPI0035C013A3